MGARLGATMRAGNAAFQLGGGPWYGVIPEAGERALVFSNPAG